jgi:tripartite ATP-independent transporter DctM subunit
MTPVEVGYIGLAFLLLILMFGIHVAPALMVVGIGGLLYLLGPQVALTTISVKVLETTNNFNFAVFPMFLLMGSLVTGGGIGSQTYEATRAWVGHFRGGLAMATIAGCGLFAACCGTSLAGTVVMGQVAYPEMKRNGYSEQLASGVIAAGGTLGILIPPSMPFIFIGILAELSIGKLFIAGILPGILSVLFLMIGVAVMCKINPKLGPSTPPSTSKEKIKSIHLTWPVIVLFLLVIGGLYGGVFTSLEAGAVGAAGALIISLVTKKMTGKSFYNAISDAGATTIMIMPIVIAAYIFNTFILITQIPAAIGDVVASLALPGWAIFVVVVIFYLIIGCFLDVMSILIITIPIVYPIMASFGFDLYWYSVIMVMCVEIGFITPPYGMNLFALKGIVNIPTGVLYRGVIPFVITEIVILAVVAAVPQISIYLIGLMS